MTAGTHTEGVGHVLKTPIWVTIVRGLIVLISFVILALSGVLIHGAYIDEFGLNVATVSTGDCIQEISTGRN